MLKKSLITFLLVFILISCANTLDTNVDTKNSVSVVKNIPLSSDADVVKAMLSGSGLFYHFQIPVADLHDVKVYLYHNGEKKEIAGLSATQLGDSDYQLYIADTTAKDSTSPSRSWTCGENGGSSKWDAPKLKDNSAATTTSGLGKMDFVMEKGKSYILAYEAFATKNVATGGQFNNLSDQSLFETELKQGNYSGFDYIYLVTINLSEPK